MLLRTVDVLEQQTKDYWKLSNTVTGRSKDKITVEKAINGVNVLEFNLGPQRHLRRAVRCLGDTVIAGKRHKFKTSATITNILLAGGVKHAQQR